MHNEVIIMMRNWLLDWPCAHRSQQAAEFYARLRRLCKFETIGNFEKFSSRYLICRPGQWAVITMLQFDIAVAAPFWTPVIESTGAATYLCGEGDELLGMRWTGIGKLRFAVFDAVGPLKTYELDEPFELDFPWSTGWKHGNSGQWIVCENPLPTDLQVKWCIYDQRKSLHKAKDQHTNRFRASLDAIKARNV